MAEQEPERAARQEDDSSPPGEFLDERQAEDTKRFIAAARELARRRAEERPWDELE